MVNLNNLFLLIENQGLSASKVSAETGISTGNISDWKKGRSMPTAQKLDILAEYFNCSVDYLLGRTDNPNISAEAYIGGDNNGVQAIKSGDVTFNNNTVKQDEMEIELLELIKKLPLKRKAQLITMLCDEVESK